MLFSNKRIKREIKYRKTYIKLYLEADIIVREEEYAAFLKRDPSFDFDKMKAFSCRMFTDMLNAAAEGDLSAYRYLFTDQVWDEINGQVQERNQRGEKLHIERLETPKLSFLGVEPSPNRLRDQMTLVIDAEYVRWITGPDGRSIEGSFLTQYTKRFQCVLDRERYVITEPYSLEYGLCPKCGKKIGEEKARTCDACGASIPIKWEQWKVSECIIKIMKETKR